MKELTINEAISVAGGCECECFCKMPNTALKDIGVASGLTECLNVCRNITYTIDHCAGLNGSKQVL